MVTMSFSTSINAPDRLGRIWVPVEALKGLKIHKMGRRVAFRRVGRGLVGFYPGATIEEKDLRIVRIDGASHVLLCAIPNL